MRISICPICGSNQIKAVNGKMTFKTPKGEISIPRVPRQQCDNCGEQFFDHAANAILDRYRGEQPIRLRKKTGITECPMCGSSRVVREIGEFVTHDGFRVPSIEYERCKSCGEKFYDPDASRAIDEALYAAGRLKKRPKVYTYQPPSALMMVSEDTSAKKYGKRKTARR